MTLEENSMTRTLLRIAAALALVQALAHTAMFLNMHPSHGADEIAVVSAMKSHAFLFGGFSRTYWDMYFGYGLLAALVVFVEAALFWLLATLATEDARRLRPIVGLFVLYNLAHAVLLSRYFFAVPIVADLVVAAALLAAWVAAGRDTHRLVTA
jgi:hypothetical protein